MSDSIASSTQDLRLEARYRVVIEEGVSLASLIEDCRISRINPEILKLHTQPEAGEGMARLIHPHPYMPPPQVNTVLMKPRRLRPATLPEVLALVIEHRQELAGLKLVALGTMHRIALGSEQQLPVIDLKPAGSSLAFTPLTLIDPDHYFVAMEVMAA
jgi:hypothetical protein